MGSRAALVAVLVVLAAASIALIGYGVAALGGAEESLVISAIQWGLLVPGYVFFALMATGSSIVNSLYTVYGYKGPNGVIERNIKYGVWFSLITIVPAWILIIADLTRRGHLAWIFLGFHVTSRIAWMALLYGLFALTLIIELVYFIRSEVSEKLKAMKSVELAIAIAVLIVTIAVHSNLGEVFGSIASVPAWYGAHLAAYFIASAVLLGAAGQLLYLIGVKAVRGEIEEVKQLIPVESKLYITMIPVLVFFVIWNAVTAWYYPQAWSFYHNLLTGKWAADFWVLEVAVGIIAPLVLAIYAIKRRSLAALVIASILLLIGGFASKYDLVIHGQESRLEFEGALSIVAASHMPVSYTPKAPEIAILAGSTLAWLFLLVLGTVLLPLQHGEKPRRLWIFR